MNRLRRLFLGGGQGLYMGVQAACNDKRWRFF